MKTILAVVAVTFCLFVAVPASAHHMAEGIVADDIYDMIEENLEGSPHLDLLLEDVGTGPGRMAVLSVTVMQEDVAEVLMIISDVLNGQGVQRSSSLDVDISLPDADGLVTITVEENIGQGESQVLPMATP